MMDPSSELSKSDRLSLRDELLADLGADERTGVPFNDFKLWVQGEESEHMRKERAMSRWRLRGKDNEEIRKEMQSLLERDHIQIIDILNRWDRDQNGCLRKHEFLVAMKGMVRSEGHWRRHGREAVDTIWHTFAKNSVRAHGRTHCARASRPGM